MNSRHLDHGHSLQVEHAYPLRLFVCKYIQTIARPIVGQILKIMVPDVGRVLKFRYVRNHCVGDIVPVV